MNVPFNPFAPKTSPAMDSVTSSPASAGGASRFVLPAFPTSIRSGQAAAPASRSPLQENGKVLPTTGTSGRTGSPSLPSAALSSSLASRLRARLPLPGTILFATIWKERVTPSGRAISRLRASAPRTSGKDCGSWPTPQGESDSKNSMGNKSSAVFKTTAGAAQLASWGTPTVQNAKHANGSGISPSERQRDPNVLHNQVHLASWPTPTLHDAERGGQEKRAMGETRHGSNLQDFALTAHWPTPDTEQGRPASMELIERRKLEGKKTTVRLSAAASWATPRVTSNGNHGSPVRANDGRARLEDQVHGVISSGFPAPMEKRGQLNPDFSRWLQGYSTEHLSCAPTAMPSSRK